jgi:hypothetical protein
MFQCLDTGVDFSDTLGPVVPRTGDEENEVHFKGSINS